MTTRQASTLHHEVQTAPWRRAPGLALQRRLSKFDTNRIATCAALLPHCNALLDIGCGNGDFLEAARQRYRHGFGIDIVPQALRHATDRCKDLEHRIDFLIGSVSQLPFPARSFDGVALISVLPFVYDPYLSLQEVHRVLRPGGTLILEVNNLVYLPRRLALLCGQLPHVSVSTAGWDGGTLHYFTRPALGTLLHETGFAPQRWTGSGVFAPWRNWWPSLLCGDLIVRAVKR